MAKLATLRDDFNGPASTVDATIWPASTGGIAQSGGRAVITAASPANSFQSGNYDLTASQAVVFIPVITPTGTTGNLTTTFSVSLDPNNRLFFRKLGGNLLLTKIVGGVLTDVFSRAWDATVAALTWWRFREAGGNVFWELSSDGVHWSQFFSIATPFDVTSVHVQLAAGWSSGVEASPGTAQIETVNPVRMSDVAGNPAASFTDVAVTNNTPAPAASLQDLAGNKAPSFTDVAVTNTTPSPDTTPPTLVSASINGGTLTLTYSEALNPADLPTPSGLTIKTPFGTERNNTGVSISGAVVTATFAPVLGTDAVTVFYRGSTLAVGNRLQDLAGNQAADLPGQGVQNKTPGRFLADAAAAADTLGAHITLSRVLADSAVTGTGALEAPGQSLEMPGGTLNSLSGTGADVVTRSYGYGRSQADAAPAADALSVRRVATRALSDPAASVESITRTLRPRRALADTAPSTEVVSRVAPSGRSVVESAPAADVATRVVAYSRATIDVAPASDLASSSGRQITRALADLAPAAETLAQRSRYGRSLSDAGPAVDVLAAGAARTSAVADNAPSADVATSVRALVRGTADTALAADVLMRGSGTTVALAELAPAVDAVVRSIRTARSAAESAPSTEALAVGRLYGRAGTDAAPAVDVVAVVRRYGRLSADLAPATEAMAQAMRTGRSVSDLGPGADALAPPAYVYGRSLSDAAPAVDVVAEVLVLVVKIVRALADSAPSTEAAARTYGHVRQLVDLALASDVEVEAIQRVVLPSVVLVSQAASYVLVSKVRAIRPRRP